MEYSRILADSARAIEAALAARMEALTCPPLIRDAMTYSLLSGGKRLRGVMLRQTTALFGGAEEEAMTLACALEMIHAYSLIHDDLPAMDNDDLRRGKPTCHKVYGEGQAILAGDGLLNLAYETMLEGAPSDPGAWGTYYEACRLIARAAGVYGMGGGQCVDLMGPSHIHSLQELQAMHAMKTGALFAASLEAGAVLGGADAAQRAAIRELAVQFGLLFQITDDILDVRGDPEKLGKSVGKDARDAKCTYITFCGMEEACRLAAQHGRLAHEALEHSAIPREGTGFFHWLIDATENRDH